MRDFQLPEIIEALLAYAIGEVCRVRQCHDVAVYVTRTLIGRHQMEVRHPRSHCQKYRKIDDNDTVNVFLYHPEVPTLRYAIRPGSYHSSQYLYRTTNLSEILHPSQQCS